MSSLPLPRPDLFADPDAEPAPPTLHAPEDLVRRYLELTAQRRAIEDELAYVRAELELAAAEGLKDLPKGRFVLPGGGAVLARMQPTCVFDKATVGRELQKAGRLVDVATLTGPALARFLAKEPVLAARLADHVRYRKSVGLMATQG